LKKQKVNYHFRRYAVTELYARKEIPYEFGLNAQLMLDEICFNWNKQKILDKIHNSIEMNNKEDFLKYSHEYKDYVWE
jgi:hypothetical protein